MQEDPANILKDKPLLLFQNILASLGFPHSKRLVDSMSKVLAITGHGDLLADQPVLSESLHRRNPHVDPLHYLQIRFLEKWRQVRDSKRTEPLRRLLALTVNGMAFGMKSTG